MEIDKDFYNLLKEYTINITEEDIFELFKIRKRFPHEFHTGCPSIEVINSYDGQTQHRGIFDSQGFLEYEKVKKVYELGHTLILSSVFDLTHDLRMLESVISDSFSFFPAQGNLYMSKQGKGGFKSHDHSYDVYVKQIYGTSHWVLGETENVTAKPGDVIYIPRFTKHFVDDTDGPRLSLTINML